MRYRVIARFSLDEDKGAVVRNSAIMPPMKAASLRNTATGTWESAAMKLPKATKALTKVLLELSKLSDPTSGHLDHLWIYIDKKEEPTKSKTSKESAVGKRKKK